MQRHRICNRIFNQNAFNVLAALSEKLLYVILVPCQETWFNYFPMLWEISLSIQSLMQILEILRRQISKKVRSLYILSSHMIAIVLENHFEFVTHLSENYISYHTTLCDNDFTSSLTISTFPKYWEKLYSIDVLENIYKEKYKKTMCRKNSVGVKGTVWV